MSAPGNSSAVSGVVLTEAQAGALVRFACEVIQTSWDGCDLDGDEIQQLALSFGLIRETLFHPARHTDHLGVGVEIGDPWFELTAWMRKARRLAAPDASARPAMPREEQSK